MELSAWLWHSIGKMSRKCLRRIVCAVSIAALASLPPLSAPAVAQQGPLLPSLGDAAADELSPAQERRVGERIMRDMRRTGTLLEDRELTRALNAFARPIVQAAPPTAQGFEFFLVRDDSLNAFALPGGFVGVHSGLMLAAETESELASVIAHEIGHVTQRHIARMLAQNRQSSLVSLAAVMAAIVAAGASNSQAAAGLVALGGSVHEQQMLAFSRDAEREADRVGLEILRSAGFEPTDMITFFSRMQRATRVYESGAPPYLRTHPLTSDRMADIRSRLGELADSGGPAADRIAGLDFELMRAKLRASAGDGRRERVSAVRGFEAERLSASGVTGVAAWYGQSVAELSLEDVSAARASLEKAGAALAEIPGAPADHAFLASQRARIVLADQGPEAALAEVGRGLEAFPDSVAMQVLQADLMLRLDKVDAALAILESRLETTRSDPELWRLLALARSAHGNRGMAHWATAERYALLGGWAAAIDQLRLATDDPSLGHYELAQVDARRREFEEMLRREREEF